MVAAGRSGTRLWCGQDHTGQAFFWYLLSGVVCAYLWGVGCASTTLPPLGSQGQRIQAEADEQRLWQYARHVEEQFNTSGWLYHDRAFEAYVNEVAQRVFPAENVAQGLGIRVRVIRDPLLNAFALPHGAVYLHTGLLAQLENEAQLAALLSHELTHITHRHAIRELRSTQNMAAFLNTAQVLLAGVPLGSVAAMLGSIGLVGSMYGYSRNLEREADMEGFRRLLHTTYDIHEAPQVFVHLQRSAQEEEGTRVPYFFSSHPRLQERIDSYEELLQTSEAQLRSKPHRVRNRAVFQQHIHGLLLPNARLDLQSGRFVTARKGIEKFLQQAPQDPPTLSLLGEVLRQQGKPDDLPLAIRAYAAAIAGAPDYPEPYRGLGLLYYKQQQREPALHLFARYLALVPHATDRGYIEAYIRTLQEGR